jgi:hypothetical protein
MHKNAEFPIVLVGHDGATNIANGQREFHLAGLTSNGQEPLRRIVPGYASMATSHFVEEEIIQPLGIESELGVYPADSVVGPGTGESIAIGEAAFHVHFDPASPSRALEITGLSGSRLDPVQFADAVGHLLEQFPEARHVSMHVLVDKEAFIRELTSFGFAISAYLPAWHKANGKRYDAVLMTRRTCTEEPVRHGTAEVIERFDRAFAELMAAMDQAMPPDRNFLPLQQLADRVAA